MTGVTLSTNLLDYFTQLRAPYSMDQGEVLITIEADHVVAVTITEHLLNKEICEKLTQVLGLGELTSLTAEKLYGKVKIQYKNGQEKTKFLQKNIKLK